MRALRFSALGWLWFVACGPKLAANPSPTDRFYTPTGVAHVDVAGSTEGVLLVVSSNFTRLFDQGAVLAVNLDQVRSADGRTLPPLGQVMDRPIELTDLNIGAQSVLEVNSLSNELVLWTRADGGVRFFTPSRAENNFLQFGDVDGANLTCPYASADNPEDCFSNAPSLTRAEKKGNGKPAAPGPIGVTVAQETVFVTHTLQANSPAGSTTNAETFLVSAAADDPKVSTGVVLDGGSFISIGTDPSYGVAATPRFAYVTTFGSNESLLRLVDRFNTGSVINPGIESTFRAGTARGIAITDANASVSNRRVFIAGQAPDTLLVLEVTAAESDAPVVSLINAVPMPSLPTELKLIERASRRPLVLVSCTGGNSLVIYDDEVGAVVAIVQGVGKQPFGIDVDLRSPAETGLPNPAARIYVTNFGDGRVAVVDIPDLGRPSDARVVAYLGKDQTCLDRSEPSCHR